MALLVLSVGAGGVAAWLAATGGPAGEVLENGPARASQLISYGAVGAVLISRRPDLSFGWLLGLGALADLLVVGFAAPAAALIDAGRGGDWAMWGIALAALQWVPDVVTGLINVRFPSGRATTKVDRGLDRAMRLGLPVAIVGSYLGDTVTRQVETELGHPAPGDRFIDGTWVAQVGDASFVLVPLLILLGVIAGIGVVVRWRRAAGVERGQLQWRAAGAIIALASFPLAVTEVLPTAFFAVAPVIFTATLLVPMLRYQLWSGDPVPRRRTIGLLVSRRTLVEAREEERRRLRRDLHDGLGPMLTGLRLTLDGAQAQLTADPLKAEEYLADAREASAQAITDLRQLVHGLRPPAIDELGLIDALRLQLSRLTEPGEVVVNLDGAEHLVLPAAVEVAVYLCAVEAVTNVVRHSDARHCWIALARSGDDVVLSIDDDGTVEATWHPGVGLSSMRERAVELGGTFLASSGPDGFHVRAAYPRRSA